MPKGPGCTLYSRLTKTTAKKPCFSKSRDAVSIPHANTFSKQLSRESSLFKTFIFSVFENKTQEQKQLQTKAESKIGVHKRAIDFRRS